MPKKRTTTAKPVLKWAGGKGQILDVLESNMPAKYNKYIEPFVGGGALFFAENPNNAIIADSNSELINLYNVIASNVYQLIDELKHYKYDKEMYYAVRAKQPKELTKIERAARMIYLNKTGFNGLYRVNKKGEFNVPFGKYKNPKILDEDNLIKASHQLQKATIINDDYANVLSNYAQEGDFIFLDPPYMPVSQYSDFKRYTKNQFGEEDQKKLSHIVNSLVNKGCFVLLTNSDNPLILDLYKDYDISILNTRRSINSKANKRTGKDILVKAFPSQNELIPTEIPIQNNSFPATRYMGSKEKLLPYINAAIQGISFNSVLDLFSGSASVSYFFKSKGKKVFSNDYMTFASDFALATVENNNVTLTDKDMDILLNSEPHSNDHFVAKTFKGLYFSDVDNDFIDLIRSNRSLIKGRYKQALISAAISRACMKRRPRGIFTYTGNRYDDGRRDLRLSLKEQFINAVKLFNASVFDNKQINKTFNQDFRNIDVDADLIYLDPPYYSKLSDNEYVRRYHFVEGLSRNWKNVNMQWNTKTKKFKNYPTPFDSKESTYKAFEYLFSKYKQKKVLVSYSSNSLPTKEELISMMSNNFNNIKIFEIDYKYSFGTYRHKKSNANNKVKEYLFLGY
ncbi:Dam family site-specific DNA-(adenine-N6)-methyltransferase [Limosilactobacillus coleohominis]|uniref:Site-specific DNA-methyltransferase (adenine-specific) n=1 Tax=Limosilactobacillus coleohominis TaxID=181675 RepID=A0ABS2GWW8_9LACO|nr:Dam family site-specific DNA-(adenine-N6)-methyltransferase [Limosilactobacillus coleohominis]MBM6940777.1 Dam family site-specific DNA-(adenine-N6)-methyltransferase [Limosilactobacillus coleohominis]